MQAQHLVAHCRRTEGSLPLPLRLFFGRSPG